MTAVYTWDVFSTLDGYGSYGPDGDWGGYWGKDGPELLEHRARRHDIVVDEETLFDFYEARVPAEVISGAHFDTWWKQERRARPELLTFDPSMLVHDRADEVRPDDFPDQWQEGAMTLPLRYHFEPGHEADGVTIDVPLDPEDPDL